MSISTSPTTRITQGDLAPLNARLESLSADAIIRWAVETFGGRLGMLSAFQQAGCLLCHRVRDLGFAGAVDVLFVDTGVNFPETLDTVDRVRREYGFNVRSLHPARTMAEQARDEGVLYLSKDGQERCCHLRKTEPLFQIVGQYDALLGSLNRGAGGKRANVPVVAIDAQLNLLRVHPLFNMTNDELMREVEEKQVIVNPLHAQGYPTVSCNRCTTPVIPGENERAGRWRHLEGAAVYCKINPTDRDGGKDEAVTLDAAVARRILVA